VAVRVDRATVTWYLRAGGLPVRGRRPSRRTDGKCDNFAGDVYRLRGKSRNFSRGDVLRLPAGPPKMSCGTAIRNRVRAAPPNASK
jgi:hypothetical protein